MILGLLPLKEPQHPSSTIALFDQFAFALAITDLWLGAIQMETLVRPASRHLPIPHDGAQFRLVCPSIICTNPVRCTWHWSWLLCLPIAAGTFLCTVPRLLTILALVTIDSGSPNLVQQTLDACSLSWRWPFCISMYKSTSGLPLHLAQHGATF